MFPAFPGFEELPLRVEVEWKRRKQFVIARLEQWPESDEAVLVCHFEDEVENGEWIILRSGGTPYWVQETLHDSWSLESDAWNLEPEEAEPNAWEPNTMLGEDVADELSANVARAFRDDLFQIARLFHLALPRAPRIVVWSKKRCAWYDDWDFNSPTRFECSHDLCNLNAEQARAQLLFDWQNPHSDAKFAWQWAGWNSRERLIQLSGIPNYFAELERTMKQILVASSRLWQTSSRWRWEFNPWGERENFQQHQNQRYPLSLDGGSSFPTENELYLWRPYLLESYAPQWREEWATQHQCIGNWGKLKERAQVQVEISSPPSAHQQLEAKLQLRDWLQDKATPAQIAALLDG